jgi:hypothetical protein
MLRLRSLAAPLAAAVAAASAAAAPAVPHGTYEYVISHAVLGRIGTHTATFTRQGDELVVANRIRLAIRVTGVTLYRFESDGSEVWRGGRLIAAAAVTNDNGRRKQVTVRAAGDRLIVDGPKGRFEAPQPAATVAFWNLDALTAPTMIEPTSGRVYRIAVGPPERETIRAMDRPVEARKYEVSGDISGELWYADDGTWVRMDFVRHGETLSLTLASIRQ